MNRSSTARSPRRRTAVVCAVLLLTFLGLSWSAITTKNATIDEPSHVLSAWVQAKYHDFRIEPGNPPLWGRWAALPDLAVPLHLRFDSPVWNDLSWDPQDSINWVAESLYSTPGNDGDRFVTRGRAMMLVFGFALGLLVAVWSYQLGGAAAAMVAVAFFSFDPNLIAHTPIIKGDVPFALVMFALAYAIWLLGRRATLARIALVGLLCGIGLNVKYSGLLLAIILVALMLLRAWLAQPWLFLGRRLTARGPRLLATFVVGVIAAAACVVVTWACYDFRFRPAPSPSSRMNMQALYDRAAIVESAAADPSHRPTPKEIAAWKPRLITRAIAFADRHHLFPQAMLAGLLYQHLNSLLWPSYLMGQLYGVGRWFYFPLATLFKTPLATLVAWVIAAAVACRAYVIHRRRGFTRAAPDDTVWTAACLAIPPSVFTLAAVQANLNVGFRHMLPLFPFLFVGIGLAATVASRHRPRATTIVTTLVLLGLSTETLVAWPDYIAFFNVAAGGSRGGFRLLGDSNLDWGQDLKGLTHWQQAHPGVPLYLSYFGTVEPHYYGLRFHPLLVSADGLTPTSDVPMTPGVLAVSTIRLQGLHVEQHELMFYSLLAQRPPDETIGGSIYLYRFP